MTKRQKLAVYRHQRSVILARIGMLRDQLIGQTSASAFATIDADLRFERDRLAWQRKWLVAPTPVFTFSADAGVEASGPGVPHQPETP